MAQFNPDDKNLDEVLAHLEKADADERERVLNAELAGKGRKTVLEKYGIDPNERRDAAGRPLYAHEVDPKEQTFAVEVSEDAEAGAGVEEQPAPSAAGAGSTPAGSGTAPSAPGAAAPGAGAGGSAGSPGL